MERPALQAIQSANDIGSAVAHRLKRAGYAPVLLESPAPGAIRRLMCFAGAVREGRADLEGITALHCATPEEALERLADPGAIPLLVTNPEGPPPLPVEVLIDARMRKKIVPPVQIEAAPLVIGIGPGFRAGVQVHRVIESNWGEALGRVIHEGESEAYTGKHRVVLGMGPQRYIYAPHPGVFRGEKDLLTPVKAGETVGWVGETPLQARADGILRGLAYPGLPVEPGAKVVEIDPTGDPANCRGIAERPARIAQGVLEAIEEWRGPD